MKPTPQAIENAARAHAKLRCQLSHSDVEFLPSDRLYAEAILRSDLGDMVLVPKEATEAMLKAAVLAIHSFAHSAERGFDQYNGPWSEEAMRVYSARLEVGYRAMLAAAEDSNDQG